MTTMTATRLYRLFSIYIYIYISTCHTWCVITREREREVDQLFLSNLVVSLISSSLSCFLFVCFSAVNTHTHTHKHTQLKRQKESNRILTPKTHQLSGFEVGDKPLPVVDAQLGDLNQTTATNALEKAQKTQQSTIVWLNKTQEMNLKL